MQNKKHWWDVKNKTTCIHAEDDKWYSKLMTEKIEDLLETSVFALITANNDGFQCVFLHCSLFFYEHNQKLAPSSGVYTIFSNFWNDSVFVIFFKLKK